MSTLILVGYSLRDSPKNYPYKQTFDQVVLVDQGSRYLVSWEYRDPASGRSPLCTAVRSYLLRVAPREQWDYPLGTAKPPIVLAGFAVRRFVELLTVECSMPSLRRPLPPNFFRDQAVCCNVEDLVLAGQSADNLAALVRCREPVDAEDRKLWHTTVGDWNGPHVNAQRDVWLTTELLGQFGLLSL